MTVGDERVRDQHRDWHGKILPIDHPFWKVNFPPNDWGCRCDVERTNEEPSPEAEIPDNLKNEKFKNNPGMTGKVFPETVYAAGFTGEEVKRIKDWGQKQFERVKQYAINYKAYQRLKKDPDYLDVAFDKKTGGVKATHRLHNFDKKTGVYEKRVQDLLYKKGYKFTLDAEVSSIPGKKVDGKINQFTHDISTIRDIGGNAVKRALNHSRKKKADVAILYFENKSLFTKERLEEGIKKYNGQSEYRFSKIIYIVSNDINFH